MVLMKKVRVLAILAALSLMLVISASAATVAWRSFSVKIPVNQGDVETTTVARASSTSEKKYFTVTLSANDEISSVRAWAEAASGANLSSPYTVVDTGITNKNISYSQVPPVGVGVKLNLDNPENISRTFNVSGKWTPN